MKQIIILVLLFPLLTKAQKISENKFDKYDSVWRIKTESVKLAYSNNPLYMSVSFMDIQQEKFKNIGHKFIKVNFTFITKNVTSLNEDNSKIQVEYTNGKVSTYQYKGGYKLLSSNDYGSMYIEFDEDESDDPILTEPIKSVRLNTRNSNYDFEVKDKKSKLVIEYLQAVKDEVKKGQK